MIQIEPDTLSKLKQALQLMKPFRIECNKSSSPETKSTENIISIEWIKENHHINKHVFSIIDNRSLCGIKSLRLTNSYDYVNETKAIRWVELFLIQIEEHQSTAAENSFNLNVFTEACAQAFCIALVPLLDDLVSMQQSYLFRKTERLDSKQPVSYEKDDEKETDHVETHEINADGVLSPFQVGLRVQVNKDQVGYLIGMNGNLIHQESFLTSLDNELVQLLHHANTFNISIFLEFIFYVQERFNCNNNLLFQKS